MWIFSIDFIQCCNSIIGNKTYNKSALPVTRLLLIHCLAVNVMSRFNQLITRSTATVYLHCLLP